MKLFTILRLAVIAAVLSIASYVQADTVQGNKAPTNEPNPKNLNNDSKDPTDIYAIPLDSSETEQQDELKDLEDKDQKAPQTTTPAQPK